DVVETECWSLGDERCRFEAKVGQGLGQAFCDSSLVHG
ncbi:MAG: 4-vinyl reductase, partial [Negativicutes bacterium]|nr:4-vinyl reductase [Negativicutes bacterium]